MLAAFGYFFMKKLIFDLVDEVRDAGSELIVKNKGLEDRILLCDIMNISSTIFVSPARVTLTLRRPSIFGNEITFSPSSSLFGFSRSPIVDELIQRVDATRRR
jgi:hypothetical protein